MTTTARTAPSGDMLQDGFASKVAFSQDPNIDLWEKAEVKMPGVDGGEPIDITTMFNADLETMAPRKLARLTPGSFQAGYDPIVIDQILAIINVNGWITHHLPDLSTIDYPGYLRSFEPNGNSIGTMPLANVAIQPTSQLAGVETGPDYTAPA